jgi:hypothetical protein
MHKPIVPEFNQGLLPFRLMLWLLWAILTTIGGLADVSGFVIQHDSPLFSYLVFWGSPTLPLFFISLGQWLLLVRLVPRAYWWLLTWVLGVGFSPLLLGFSFVGEGAYYPAIGEPNFWAATLLWGIVAFVMGSIVGIFQCLLVIRPYGTSIKQCLGWVVASAIAWGIGFPLGTMFTMSIAWNTYHIAGLPLRLLIAAAIWGTIGIVTGASLFWVRRLDRRG